MATKKRQTVQNLITGALQHADAQLAAFEDLKQALPKELETMKALKRKLAGLSETLGDRIQMLGELMIDLHNMPDITEQASDDQDDDDAASEEQTEEQEYELLEELVQSALEDSQNISKRLDRLKGSTAAKVKKLGRLKAAFAKAKGEVNERIVSLEEKIAILAPPKVENGWLSRKFSALGLAGVMSLSALAGAAVTHYNNEALNSDTGVSDVNGSGTPDEVSPPVPDEVSPVVQAFFANPDQIKQISVDIMYSGRLSADFYLRTASGSNFDHGQDHINLDLEGDTVELEYWSGPRGAHDFVWSQTIPLESVPVSIRDQIVEHMKALDLPLPASLGGDFTALKASVEDELAECAPASDEDMLAGQIIDGTIILNRSGYRAGFRYKFVKCGNTPRYQAPAEEFIYDRGRYRFIEGTSDLITEASQMDESARQEIRERIEKIGMPVPLAFQPA